MYMDRPIIGIVSKHLKHPKNAYSAGGMIRNEMANAVIQCEGLPIGLPLPAPDGVLTPKQKQATFARYFELCDGLIFQGGNYIHPDEYDLACLAYYRNIPTLGVCSGQTVMALAICHQTEIVDVDAKYHKCPGVNDVHGAIVLPNTVFHSIVKDSHIAVNSRHVYSIASLPHSSLHASALSPEGHAEVIEDPSRNFYLATRFHPESNLDDPHMLDIFKAFLRACQVNAAYAHYT